MSLDWTLAIALWGAGTGTLSLIIGVAAYLRDRPAIRVTATSGRIIAAGSHSPFMMFIEAVNRGRRDVQIVSAGIETDRGERMAAFGDLRTPSRCRRRAERVNPSVGHVVGRSNGDCRPRHASDRIRPRRDREGVPGSHF